MMAEPLAAYVGPLQLELLEGCDVPLIVRFGGASAPGQAMLLRFGPMTQDGSIYGHLLAEIGGYRHVVHDAVVWDYALRDFALCEAEAIDRLAEKLDLVAYLFGSAGRFLQSTIEIVLDILQSLLTPSFFVIGGIGTVIGAYLIYYLLLYLLAHWAAWFVILPCTVLTGVCFSIRDSRLRAVREAVLAAARSAFAATSQTPWRSA